MKPYIFITLVFFFLVCSFKLMSSLVFAHSQYAETYKAIHEIFLVIFNISLVVTIIKYIFRKGTQKINM